MPEPVVTPDVRRRRREPEPIGVIVDRIRKRLADRGVNVDADVDWAEVEAEAYAESMAERDAIRVGAWSKVVPAEYVDASIADLDDIAGDAARRWLAADPKPNLVLSGPVGVGKTHAAFAVGHAAIRDGMWVYYTTTHDLIQSERPGGDRSHGDKCRSMTVLICDDMGVEPPTDWAVAALTDIIDERLREKRTTIVTTNANYPDLAARYGERIMSRLVNGRAIVARMTGEDRRAQKF